MKPENYEMLAAEAIAEKPVCLTIAEEKFEIKPPTFGKLQLLSRLYLMLDIDEDALVEHPHAEVMRLCESKTDIICHIMATATFDKKEELLDDEMIQKRAEFFKWNCQPEHYATVLMAIIAQNNHEGFISSIRLTKYCRLNKPNQ